MKCDIAIIGGGIVGTLLAIALAKKTSLSIALIEAKEKNEAWTKEHYHHRVSAITLASQKIFKSLDIWEDICAHRVSVFTDIFVWEEASNADIHFDCREIAKPQLGFIIENNLIQYVLNNKLKEYPQIKYLNAIELTHLTDTDKGIELTCRDHTIIKAKLAIAADGAGSWLRQAAGIEVDKKEYEQSAIVATVKTQLSHEKAARQVFLKTGPLAFLPLDEPHTSSIVWSLSKDEASELLKLEETVFKLKLTNAFSAHLGGVTEIGARYCFPLRMQQARNYIKGHVVLVGDAAHVIHPLAGQGVNVGLLDAASLAEVIEDALCHHRDFAGTTTLRRYERWRRADNATMLLGVDFIKTFFASENKTIQQIRSLGVTVTNKIATLKNIFARHAVGVRDGLPALAKE